MEGVFSISRRRARVTPQACVSRSRERKKSRFKEKETPDAVDLSPVHGDSLIGGQRRFSASCRRLATSGSLNYFFQRYARVRNVFLLLAGIVFLVSVLPFFGMYLLRVSSHNMARSHVSRIEAYLHNRRVRLPLDGDGSKAHRRASTGTKQSTEVNSALSTSGHDLPIHDAPKELRNSFLGRKGVQQAPRESRESSALAEKSPLAELYMARGEAAPPRVHDASQSTEKSDLAIRAESCEPPTHGISTTSKITGSEKASFLHLNSLTGPEQKEHIDASLVSTASTSHGATQQGIEASPQDLQRDDRIKKFSNPGLSYQQFPTRSATVFAPTATALSQVETAFPSAAVANVGGSDGMGRAESTIFSTGTHTPNLSSALLSADTQLPHTPPAPADQQLLLLMQPAGQPASGTAATAQTAASQSPAPSGSPQQQLTPTTFGTTQGTAPTLQGPADPFSSLPPATGVQNTSNAATGGAPGIPSFAPALGMLPSNLQPIPTAPPAPAQPVAAPLPMPPASVITGLPPGDLSLNAIFATRPPAVETRTGAPAGLSPVPVFTGPGYPPALPAFMPPTIAAGTPSQPTGVPPPPSAPTPVPAQARAPSPTNATPIPAPTPTPEPMPSAAPGKAATERGTAEVPPPLADGTSVAPAVRNDGKARTRPSAGTWGALLPPTGLNVQEPPTSGAAADNQGAAPSGGAATALGGFTVSIEGVAVRTIIFVQSPTCLETCECVALILGGVSSLIVCLMSVLIVTLLMSKLFSKGFFSMAFFKGGANIILVAGVLGFTIGGLTGGLVRRCWPGALYFGGGLMSFFVALVLLGKRGAAIGAIGGVISGGSIGGLASIDALPITLGCIVGLLLGIVLGFAPILRDLKMNTRYIRYGFETRQPSMPRAETSARATRADASPTKRLTQRLFSSPSKTSSLRTTASLPIGDDSLGRRAESFPSSS